MDIELPEKGKHVTFEIANGQKFSIKNTGKKVYVLTESILSKNGYDIRFRWGNETQILEVVKHILAFGMLPKGKFERR